jgi:hypothetical protein
MQMTEAPDVISQFGTRYGRKKIAVWVVTALFFGYLTTCLLSLSGTSESLVLNLRVAKQRPIASRLVLPDWVFNLYWYSVGERRLENAATRDISFVKSATGVWIQAYDDPSLDHVRANNLLASYVCAQASSPEGEANLEALMLKYPTQKKIKLLSEACLLRPYKKG